MMKIAKYVIGAAIALSASAAAAEPTSPQSNSSCYERYGYYGYSSAYCKHDVYGRSSPADRYYSEDRALVSQNAQQLGQEPDRDRYSYLYRGIPAPNDTKRLPDRDRDLG